MDMVLPKGLDGKQVAINDGNRQVTVVGANGSGKSRFVEQMMRDAGEKAFSISALDALFGCSDTTASNANSIASIFHRVVESSQFVKPAADNEFEMLLYLLMTDEMADLLAYKLNRHDGDDQPIPTTKIDTVIRLWKTVFPKNEVLRESGLIQFKNTAGAFKPVQLSHGEKAVFFYIGASLYAPPDSIIFVDAPTLFLHQSITQSLWSAIEGLRSDCTFVYQTHDLEFPTSRTDNLTIWVRSCDIGKGEWDYEILRPHEKLSEQLIIDLIGSRKPVLFIEGDDTHSIDSKLYALIFPEYTLKSMGSCEKVIETVRSFNDMKSFHHLDSMGIVDRDRRNEMEVKYLRDKNILVPNVAEIENLMMLEGVIRTVARYRHKNDIAAYQKIRSNVIAMFKGNLRKQALMHTRHRVKRTMEVVIDRKFENINALEEHMVNLVEEVNPRAIYEKLCREFNSYVQGSDYNAILRVFNQKSMLVDSNLSQLCGVRNKDEYIKTVLYLLKRGGEYANNIRRAIKHCFQIDE